jgi:hypothetical protein
MSTPRRVKEMRMEAHRQEKIDRERKELFSVPSKKTKKEFIPYVPQQVYRKDEQIYASATSNKFQHQASATAKPSRTEYSGDYIVGIATMHKSNLVPVGRGDNPEDYSTMRRN